MIDIDVYNQLMPNPLTMIVQLCSTTVLFLLFYKLLWPSVKNYLAKRADQMQKDLLDSAAQKEAAEKDRADAREQLMAASGKADEIVEAAVKEAKIQKDAILSEAAKEADLERAKARDQIASERRSMYSSIQNEMVEVAMAATEKLMQEKDLSEMDRAAVDAFVKEATPHAE